MEGVGRLDTLFTVDLSGKLEGLLAVSFRRGEDTESEVGVSDRDADRRFDTSTGLVQRLGGDSKTQINTDFGGLIPEDRFRLAENNSR